MTCKPIKNEQLAPLATCFGDEIHSDLWGPSLITSLRGCYYYVTFTDDHTHYTCINILKTKDQTLAAYKVFAAWAHMQYRTKIKALRSDHSSEYTGHTFTEFLQEEGTKCRLMTHNTLQHNGIAELLNCQLLEQVQARLLHSGLPKTLWGEALHFAVWLKNCTST
jgi:transposase InsO family protein